MMNETDFQQYCHRLNLPEAAVQYINRVRSSGPSRKVRCGPNNVIAQYPSRKMNRLVPAESHTVELAFIQQVEHDDTVIEYYAQPWPIKLNYPSAIGRPVGVIHTPDLLLLSENEAGWIECKPEDQLQQLKTKQPHRYRPDGDGGWRCPPGEDAAKPLGLFYRVWSSAELNPILVRNLHFLEDYLDPNYPDVPKMLKSGILEAITREPGVSAQTLIEQRFGCTYDHILNLLGKGAIYADLKEFPLNEPDRVRLYSDEVVALTWRFAQRTQPVEVLDVDPLDMDLRRKLPPSTDPPVETPRPLSQEAKDLLRRASLKDLDIANNRFHIIHAKLDKSAIVQRRAIRKWKARFRLAEECYGCGFVGLLPRYSHQGNHMPRLPAEVYELADQVIAEHFHNVKGKTRVAAYGVLQVECERRGLLLPSYVWFGKRIRYKATPQTAEIRDGHYLPSRIETGATPGPNHAHGDRPWDVVHIDHTLCDIELVDEQNGLNLGRPWLTVAFDAYSRRVLAFYISFDHPSYRSCLMVLRECVSRHGRLPACLIVDGGPEFKHLYFSAFCSRYQITLKTRPADRPYFGSVIERMFGTIGTEFFQNLAGNTRILKTAIKITSSIRAQRQAVWSLEALHELLSEYCYEIYDNRIHPAQNMTPAQTYERGMAVGGTRQSRCVTYDDNLIAMTLPTNRAGGATIQRGMGVKINHIYYWAEEMRDPRLNKRKIPVRFDPWRCPAQLSVVLRASARTRPLRLDESQKGQTRRLPLRTTNTIHRLAADV